MKRTLAMTMAALVLSVGSTRGCVGRMVGEGMGATMGASGKAVTPGMAPDLTRYRGLRVEPIKRRTGLAGTGGHARHDPGGPGGRGRGPGTGPRRRASRPQPVRRDHPLRNGGHGGYRDRSARGSNRSRETRRCPNRQGHRPGPTWSAGQRQTTSSGPKNLSGGVGKALDKWLKEGGLKKVGEKEQE